MINIKNYIGKLFVGKNYRFISNCCMAINITGRVVGYSIINNNLILKVQTPNNKIIKIDTMHPSLSIEEIS